MEEKSPSYRIVRIRTGLANSYLVENGSFSMLVDTGIHGFMPVYHKRIRALGMEPSDIRLIVLTHTHYDHTGNLEELKKFTGATVVVHQNEFENLKSGFTRVPSGITPTTRIISGIGKFLFPRYASPRPFVADRTVNDESDLAEYGINGKIIPTPGHTNGSLSVLVGTTLLAGDTFLNIRNGMVFPHFVNDPRQLLETWKDLFIREIELIYPGHGEKFRIEMAKSDYDRWNEKLCKK